MRNIPLVVAIIVLAVFTYVFLLRNDPNQSVAPLSPTPIPALSEFCKTTALEAKMTTEGAAGNIFGSLSIKNVSKLKCQIFGNNYVVPQASVENLKIAKQGQAGPADFILYPEQVAYSQIHYPNGAQCSGPVKQTNILYAYKFSPYDIVVFKNPTNTVQTIGVCNKLDENTQIDVWSLYTKPINQ